MLQRQIQRVPLRQRTGLSNRQWKKRIQARTLRNRIRVHRSCSCRRLQATFGVIARIRSNLVTAEKRPSATNPALISQNLRRGIPGRAAQPTRVVGVSSEVEAASEHPRYSQCYASYFLSREEGRLLNV